MSGLFQTVWPEPARFWIRYRPRHWPGPERPWVDLATGALGAPRRASEGPTGPDGLSAALAAARLDDVLYLPPVPTDLAADRDAVARAHLERGTPVLVQLLPGDGAAPPGAIALLDLLPCLVAGLLPEVPAGARAAAWPTLPLPPARRSLRDALPGHLAAARVSVLQAAALELEPRDRRRLAELLAESEALALFHAAPPRPRDLDRLALAAGLEPLLSRPLPRPPLPLGNLALAGWLATAGELAARLERPPSQVQAFLRAAREAERSRLDLAGLARDGNLEVVPWLAGEPGRLAAEALAGTAPPPLVAALERELGEP